METVKEIWNMECPNCKSDEGLELWVIVTVRLTPDGTDEGYGSDHIWDGDSACSCVLCGWSGKAGDTNIKEQK
jgi:Zn ribbon nucleic-acid-binding protein